ncbi:cation diffusion facilitator family transporter [uncultured Flavobacterium sp.]|uniref:cation transporter n=1 Tax=uncultured Flavobacterium sp. TaxID=165435 RepID=UPI002592C16A|nr:cation diffusion facilitator family transporter [uncultured Flavobacterium sp.]
MNKSKFKITKMDCPSEEGIIKMKLNGNRNIHSMDFDIPNRELVVYHSENYQQILQDLESLNFGTTLISSEYLENFIPIDNSKTEKKLLWQVLIINFFFFILELVTGLLSNSMGLVADGLDMLADSIVYILALFAVGAAVATKKYIIISSGFFQLILAISGFIEVFRRFLYQSENPNFKTMIIISLFALLGNAICLYLLQKSKSNENYMKASMIFTSNDVIVNVGVIFAGTLVYLTQSKIPDLIIGIIVFALVAFGSFRIFKLSRT